MTFLNDTSATIAKLVPECIARESAILPLRIVGETLVFGSSNPDDLELRKRITFVMDHKVRFVYRSPEIISEQLDAIYNTLQFDEDDQTYENSWYWPCFARFEGKTLIIPATGWDGAIHWSGTLTLPDDHPNFLFWKWIIAKPQYRRLINETQLKKIRRVWNRLVSCRRQSTRECRGYRSFEGYGSNQCAQ